MKIEYFKMIDEIVAVSHDLSAITCRSVVPAACTVFEGHFPGDPLLPGALSVEIMAQAAGFLAMLNVDLTKMGYLLAIDGGRFREPIRPGDRLTVKAQRKQLGSGYAAFECSIDAAAARAASAAIRIKLADFKNGVLRDAMLTRVNELGIRDRVVAATASA